MGNFPNIDEVDRQLLAAVQVDNRQSIEALGEKVNASPSTVQRRLAKLRDAGVIEADISIVSQEAVGWPMTYIVEVGLESNVVVRVDRHHRWNRERAGHLNIVDEPAIVIVRRVDLEHILSSGVVQFYLVRPRHSCGNGPLGSDSSGAPRVGVSCP